MFGDNPVRSRRKGDTFLVQEIFDTIQGEGPFAGTRATFVRLAGCNLRCWFCDTDFESNFDKPPLTLDDIVLRVRHANVITHSVLREPTPHLIVITGGEPFLQRLDLLVPALLDTVEPTHVQIETAGTLWCDIPAPLSSTLRGENGNGYSIVVSPKTGKVHAEIASRALAWKYLMRAGNASAFDGLPEFNTQVKDDTSRFRARDARIARPPRNVPSSSIFVQPIDEYTTGAENYNAAVNAALKFGYRVSVQMHKVLGVE